MKKCSIQFFIWAFFVPYTLNSCNHNNANQQESTKFNKAEQFWTDFANALEKSDLDYLIRNSLDTIQCGDCGLSANKSEFFKAEFLFKNHLAKVQHVDSLFEREYFIDDDGNLVRINYRIKAEKAPEGAYNLIFTCVKTPDGYKFQGVFPVP